jgi:hypothetical protein
VQREAIEQELEKAGWELDYGFSGHLLIGGAGDLSILVPWRDGHAVAPQYELYDAHRNLACRVGMIPDPLRAQITPSHKNSLGGLLLRRTGAMMRLQLQSAARLKHQRPPKG